MLSAKKHLKDLTQLSMKTRWVILIFISAIVISNLVLTHFERDAVYLVGFFIIPFDLITRDILHQRWKDKIAIRMGGLILGGGLLTWLLVAGSGVIVIASVCAFVSAALTNTLIYHLMLNKRLLIRMQTSSSVAAMVDSFVFITIAFGFDLRMSLIQMTVKILGTYFWTLIYLYKNK